MAQLKDTKIDGYLKIEGTDENGKALILPEGSTIYVGNKEFEGGSGGSGDANVQSDWNESTETSDAFIKNKPPIENGAGKNALQGIDSVAIGNNSVALGGNTIAGCKGFYIKSIDLVNKKIYLCNEKVLPEISTDDNTDTTFETPGYEVGDSFNIINDKHHNYHYILCSTISAISNNVITYEGGLGFTKIIEGEPYVLLIPAKPTVGEVLISNNSSSIGENTIASGRGSHAEGGDTIVIGDFGHAEGKSTIASHSAHAEGNGTKALGKHSHSEGNGTNASGESSHAEGYKTTASGHYSHAEGNGTTAEGCTSHAEGLSTFAKGEYSHAEGYKTTAEGHTSHAEGNGTKAEGHNSHAEGADTLAFANQSHAEGLSTFAKGEYSHAEGYKTTAEGHTSHAEGNGTTAEGHNSHAEGNGTTAKGGHSHAEGLNTFAKGEYSHAEGFGTTAEGHASHAEGSGTTAKGEHSHAEGLCTFAKGEHSHAEGYGTTAEGHTSHAEGADTLAFASHSHAEGVSTKAYGFASHVQGKYNKIDSGSTDYPNGKYAHIVGNGTSSTELSNAHTVSWEGQGYFAQGTTMTGADYAEFFEWQDGNPDNEDRVGLLVALDEEKIKLANSGDEILGIISGTAAVLGDNYECEWNGKYLTDDFGRVIYDLVEEFVDEEHIEFKEVEKEIIDEETNETRIEIELEEVKTVEKQSLGFWKHPRINPDYDPEQAYVNRANRPEWDTVGMLGKLYVRDDGTCIPNFYATVGENGVATSSLEKTNMRVLSRVNENVVRVLLK